MKTKQLLNQLDSFLMKFKIYRWCKKEDVKSLINKVRSIKQKLSHDNLFDISLGAILALIGLKLYLNVAGIDKAIIIVLPFLTSWLNELLNKLQGAKFGWIDLLCRSLIGIILYLIV